MEIRSKFTVSIPRYLVNVLGIDEKTKFVPAFRDGKLELEIFSENRQLAKVGDAVMLNLDQDEWVRSGIIAGRKRIQQIQGEAYEDGYGDGYDEGFDEGTESGYDEGERDGYVEGYRQGYSDCNAGNPFDDSFPYDEEDDECDGDCENCPHRHD